MTCSAQEPADRPGEALVQGYAVPSAEGFAYQAAYHGDDATEEDVMKGSFLMDSSSPSVGSAG